MWPHPSNITVKAFTHRKPSARAIVKVLDKGEGKKVRRSLEAREK
jgi:hypothetical protein